MVGVIISKIKEEDEMHYSDDGNFREISPGLIDPAVMPKHIPFPKMSSHSELLHELILFLFTTCVAMMQFINIYRTHWWLPKSQMTEYVKMEMVDPMLVIVILAMNSRRLIYILSLTMLDRLFPSPEFTPLRLQSKTIIEYILLVNWMAGAVIITSQDLKIALYFLLYLIGMYLVVFGLRMEPFLRYSSQERKGAAFLNGMPMHSCSMNATEIREEVQCMRNDFNDRLRQIFFTSMIGAFYAGYLPCAFASNYVHYNRHLTLLNTLIIWIIIFGMGIGQNFPSKYTDILHRTALHLGGWHKFTRRTEIDPLLLDGSDKWTKGTIWLHNSVVEYGNHFYQCVSSITVAIPGNSAHKRFYNLFNNPSRIYDYLTRFQFLVIIVTILIMYFITEWHHIVTMVFLNLTNQFIYYKLKRDYLVSKYVYEMELKTNSASSSSL